ncbi:hypothetical protein GCM10027160_52090 [Streptomyces calidiresistens]|uniref:ASCH domain-containing protein n=1 Tax=Streptomyces calidiresistens TaxID=1485586 RepID=A0A7W3T7E7_9ACTN|nr:ASCH domain-containing protein [Streptomyces calidiresistens]MBB0232183.1 ASCH domain-containing protein [Streptomyces calidiresistens]
MRALTIRQPWIGAILHGPKRIENRSWAPPVRHVGTRIALHAAGTVDHRATLPITPAWPDQRGAILGTATLAAAHRAAGCCAPWGHQEPGLWHWELGDIHVLEEPLPCRGALCLWTPPPAVQAALA